MKLSKLISDGKFVNCGQKVTRAQGTRGWCAGMDSSALAGSGLIKNKQWWKLLAV